MNSDESGGGQAPGEEMDPAAREVMERLAEMQISLLSEVAEIHEARGRLQADARERLEQGLGRNHPRVKALRAATAESSELTGALRKAAGGAGASKPAPKRKARKRAGS
jgi:hypothetical protein